MTARAPRPIPLALTTLIAIFSAVVALALSGGGDAHAHGTATAVTAKQLAFHDDMRKLWEDHVTWTRLAVISLVAGSPDAKATVARLLRNQAEIGDAVVPFYGKAGGAALTRLLRDHILVAADVIAAAKSGDAAKVAAEQERWHGNADELASFLAKANPQHWRQPEMRTMLYEHLKLTTDEVVARLQRKWAADVRAYDRIHVQALGMADMLADGIVEQFPDRFR